ncbi:glutathione S-transferase omega-1-like [Hyla sarda]|uniref:glutathione S-transferase omega-1-like n=1 Tax=Hyla sarda TaxID=327740 RepID=UPI0024C44125|nr:glutathione S-transferase omega-1-like [Hyla sarda]XP_056385163.1 glutathione S-transferase omega-1-like [Hyla sarda]XP_056385164.1 glutathione S-transferase omega-1-like [Hyla sarda]
MSRSQRSLTQGSAAPGPVPEGILRLYSMRFCPFVQRALLVLVAKGIKYEIVTINLQSKPEWYFEKSPHGLVPSIETSDGKIIYDSPIVCDYLDEAYPGKKLTPADPYKKAQEKMILELFSGVSSLLISILYARKRNEDITELKTKAFEKFKKLEEALTKRNTPYFGGESVSMIDYMMWPWFERFIMFDVTEFLEKFPRMNAWHKLMLQDPAVKQTFIQPDVYLGFFKLYSQDRIEAADYGLE